MNRGARWAAAIGAVALMLARRPGAGDGAPALVGAAATSRPSARACACRSTAPGRSPGSVPLRVARYGEPSRKPTLLYLSGGPGGAGVREFADVLFEVEPLARRYQLFSLRPARHRRLGADPLPGAGARRAAALHARGGAVRARGSARGEPSTAPTTPSRTSRRCGMALGVREADAVRHLLRHEARARVRARAPGPRRADGAGLGAGSRRRRRVRARALPRDGAVAGRAVPARAAAGVSADPARRPRAAGGTAAGGADARARLRHARAQAAGDADRARAVRPDVRRRLQPARSAPAIPAAVRAALDHRDPAPLLRLAAGAEGLVLAPGPARRSPPRATPRCARRRRCRGRAGRRSASAGAGAGGGGPARAGPRSSRSATRRRAPTRSTSACAGPRRRPRRRAAAPTRPSRRSILQGGEDLRTPPAGSARVAAALPGAQRVRAAGRRARGDGRRPDALRRAAAVRVPARAAGVGARASAWRRSCRRSACRRLTLGGLAPAPGVPGVRGRTLAALDLTLDDLTFALSPALGSPLAGPGLRGGTFRLRRGGIELRGLRAVRGVRVSGVLPRRGSAVAADLPGARAASGRRADLAARRGARAAGRPARARRACGQARRGRWRAARGSVAKSARFRHRAAFSSVRPRS